MIYLRAVHISFNGLLQKRVKMSDLDLDELRKIAEAATPGSWTVFDMDEAGKMKSEPMNEPGQGWYWVWAEERLPYYGGILEPEKHHPDCGSSIGVATISDNSGGLQELADATHVATFDPPTVLALLDLVAELEAKIERITSLADKYGAYAEHEPYGGELWSTTEMAIYAALETKEDV